MFSRIGFLLFSILGGAFIGAMLALVAWVTVKQLMRKGNLYLKLIMTLG
jgi:heme O synthase-like polyprenyltransferase